ncbi:hypothetical protein JCM10908_004901 [Rhodotorula pacifica]|uniref:uncharacterized protein n=1 Tax=Rhodotorula pacifica TaxID=1495444 RepID=UPI00316C5C73
MHAHARYLTASSLVREAKASTGSAAPQAGATSPKNQRSSSKQDDPSGPSSDSKPPRKLRSPTDPASDYQRKLEERFGGGESAALGTLVDGKPEGLAANVKRNMFRLI